ncbi:serine/threonine-protein kinase fused [Fopius arisanus]|uniref:non-specific serine/threonine protein kinase n=1 Tax=Fopius arisanus TaxID=64838 RepID=A0A9R1TWE9_9HYME|nr:PREDICTED: serine/threonine-protein kinase fused [Fopius arisanus]
MEKYIRLYQVGEGSFGQVFKGKKCSDGEIVAIKIIRKIGRSSKELHGLRQECEIQKHLHHPNIVQMIDSFETEKELVVVTEYADKELYDILGQSGRLSEERTQVIACDLVSALYYLHSNRVLHRDLKPQNVLVESNGVAKLCDFGFARSMSTGTHVLTSIKGTPLYMAPELIEEHPYDHNADLWSLGCIVYELLVGFPPFQTTSILHLVKLIRFEAVKWPEFLSPHCKSFLQGLLQKDPSKRLTWPELLDHPFVKGRILILNGEIPMAAPFTTPLSASQALAKQRQLQHLAMQSASHSGILEKAVEKVQAQERKLRDQRFRTCMSQPRYPMTMYCPYTTGQPFHHPLGRSQPSGTDSSASVDVLLENLSLRASLQSDLLIFDGVNQTLCPSDCPSDQHNQNEDLSCLPECMKENVNQNIQGISGFQTGNEPRPSFPQGKSRLSADYEREFGDDLSQQVERGSRLPDWDARVVEQHIENEEWVAFLQRSMEEIIDGEITSLLQENCVSVFVSPLRNSGAGCKVIEFVACLLSLPFVVAVSKDNLRKIEEVYLDVRVVPNLVYAVKLFMSEKNSENAGSEENSKGRTTRLASSLSADELQTIECIMLILCRLVYANEKFLTQFCDAVYIVNGVPFLQQLYTLEKRKPRVVADLVAIFNNILRSQPENAELVEKVVLGNAGAVEQFVKLLSHRQIVLRVRGCILIKLLARFCCRALQQIWGRSLKNLLEGLILDDHEGVKKNAEGAVGELKQLNYYEQHSPC